MDVLLLSSAWEPMARVTWQRAVSLLFAGKAEVVESYEDRQVRSITITIKMPSVIRVLRRSAWRKRSVRFSRENVYLRDAGLCQYCGKAVSRADATFDHVKPKSQGGTRTWDNIVLACVPCNQKKADRSPERAGMKLRATPRKPDQLPDYVTFTVVHDKNTPPTWKGYFRDFMFWMGEFDADQEQ